MTQLIMFFLGAFSTLAQVLMARELLFVFSGNELVVGLTLGVWLLGTAAGALAGRFIARKAGAARAAPRAAAAALAFMLPAAIMAARHVRLILAAPFGGELSAAAMAGGAALLLAPVCATAGTIFPCLCAAAADKNGQAITRLYAADSLGSLCGGVLFSFVLAGRVSALPCAALAGCFAMAASGLTAPDARRGTVAFVAAAIFGLAAAAPWALAPLNAKALEARWKGLGVSTAGAGKDGAGPRLAAEFDSIYQNLALIETAGLYSAFGNGKIMFSFPDPISAEHKANLLMAQAPRAKHVLTIGGNPADDLREFLKFPLDRLVYVELDASILKLCLAAGFSPPPDPRLEIVSLDGPLFLKTARQKFDLIAVEAPPPSTAGLNRFFTREFYMDARRLLSENGVFYTAAEGAESPLGEQARIAASIYKALESVFPVVMASGGDPVRFFAGFPESGITFNPENLRDRARNAGVQNEYFTPEFFLGADDINEARAARAAETYGNIAVAPNTVFRPAAYFHHILLWTGMSGPRVGRLLKAAQRMNPASVACVLLSLGLAAVLASFPARRFAPGAAKAWAGKAAPAFLLSGSGFWGMSMEMLLIILIQSFFGYIYARIGLVISCFMFGLAAGAFLAGIVSKRRGGAELAGILVLETAMCAMTLAIGFGFSRPLGGEMSATGLRALEAALFGATALAGAAVGAEFALAAIIMRKSGMRPSAAGGLASAVDLAGAAAGSLAASVVLLPVLGISGTALVLAAVKACGAMTAASARLARAGAETRRP